MANDDRTRIIPRRTPESAVMSASVKRAMAITANLNRLTFNDAEEFRALWSFDSCGICGQGRPLGMLARDGGTCE